MKAKIKLPIELRNRVISSAKYYFKGDVSRILFLQTGMNTENGSMLNEFQRDPNTEFYKSADLYVIGGCKDSQGNNYTIYGITDGIPATKHQTIFIDKSDDGNGNEITFYQPIESIELTETNDQTAGITQSQSTDNDE